jgi:hypothetical protein
MNEVFHALVISFLDSNPSTNVSEIKSHGRQLGIILFWSDGHLA